MMGKASLVLDGIFRLLFGLGLFDLAMMNLQELSLAYLILAELGGQMKSFPV